MNVSGMALAQSIDKLSAEIQAGATQTRNESFAIAGEEVFLVHKPTDFDSNSQKLRNLMTRLRSDSNEDLPKNLSLLLAEYPDLRQVDQEELKRLTKALSKAARSANGILSMVRVKMSIVRAVVRPLFFEYPLKKLARETGQQFVFDEEATRKKSDKLRAGEIGPEDFIEWTRTVFELFQDSSVLQKSSSREFTGTRMPGVVNSVNIRRYTNVWFNFTSQYQDQILDSAQGNQSGDSSIASDATNSQVRPRYSSFGSPFSYNTLTRPSTKISILIYGLADPSRKLTRDWTSKDSFERELQTWTIRVLETFSLTAGDFCLEVKVKTDFTQTGIEIWGSDAETACKDAFRFLKFALTN